MALMATILTRRARCMLVVALIGVGFGMNAIAIRVLGEACEGASVVAHAMREALRGEGNRHKAGQQAAEKGAQQLHHGEPLYGFSITIKLTPAPHGSLLDAIRLWRARKSPTRCVIG